MRSAGRTRPARRAPALSALILCVSIWPTSAEGQGVGFQGGASLDPEQAYVGSHAEFPIVADELAFRPGVEGGFSEGLTLATINLEFLYTYWLAGSQWGIYQGGGPAVVLARAGNRTDTRAGLSASFGFTHRDGFFAEFKVGGRGSPGLKLGVGYTIR